MLATEPRWTIPRHIDLIDGLLVDVAAGERKRVIVTVPIRHGKSEICSRFFPAWLLGMRPDCRVVVAGYGAEFAEEWGQKARDLMEEHGQKYFGVGVSKASKAKSRWTIEQYPGGMFALGVGSPLTGRGANVLVIDDPVKNSEEADSELLREKVWRWYWSTARTRLEPQGAVVILMARWHEDDLVGRLLNHPADIEPWTVVNLPALAEDDDPLGREPGDPLWPERFSREELEATRVSQLPHVWSSLYQQRPAPAEGLMFKRHDFRYWRIVSTAIGAVMQHEYVLPQGENEMPKRWDTGLCVVFQTVDAAISDKETADWTVVATWAATPDGDLLLLDLERQHFEEFQVVDFLMRMNDKHGNPPMWIERFGAGRNPLAIIARQGRYPIAEIPEEAGTKLNKVTRAFGAITLYGRHKVFHPAATDQDPRLWLADFESELCVFDKGRNDDQVDVTSYAARLLPSMGVGGVRKSQVEAPAPFAAGVRGMAF